MTPFPFPFVFLSDKRSSNRIFFFFFLAISSNRIRSSWKWIHQSGKRYPHLVIDHAPQALSFVCNVLPFRLKITMIRLQCHLQILLKIMLLTWLINHYHAGSYTQFLRTKTEWKGKQIFRKWISFVEITRSAFPLSLSSFMLSSSPPMSQRGKQEKKN